MTGFISTRIADPKHAALVVTLFAFGLLVALFALAFQKQAALAKRWPVVPGTIKLSEVEQYRAAPEQGSSEGRTMYRRKVSYSYKFNDIAYTNADASLATNTRSTSGWLVRKFTSAYRDGATVGVHVNPANPSEAVLNPGAGYVWIIWLVVALMWAGAYCIARFA